MLDNCLACNADGLQRFNNQRADDERIALEQNKLADGVTTAPVEQPRLSDDSQLEMAAISPPETARALCGCHSCVHCGKPLEGGRRQRRHCNGRCRAAASRERNGREFLARLSEVIGARH